MSRTINILFIIFNIIYFIFDWTLLPYVPNPILFGWLPLQFLLLFGSPILAAIVWGVYFNSFFNTQKHVDYTE